MEEESKEMGESSKKHWMCPVCNARATSGTFACTGCYQWVHPKCGNYTQNDLKAIDKSNLRCNLCKETTDRDETTGDTNIDFLTESGASASTLEIDNDENVAIKASMKEDESNASVSTMSDDDVKSTLKKKRKIGALEELEIEDDNGSATSAHFGIWDDSDSDMETAGDELSFSANTTAQEDAGGSRHDAWTYDVPYELISQKSGKGMGIVNIVRCMPNELVHGRELLPQEKKVQVKEVYPGGTDAEDEAEQEFVVGAYLRTNKIFLRKLSFKRLSSSKKKGRGHKTKTSPQKWTKVKRKILKNSGKEYISSSNKLVSAKRLMPFHCTCRFTQCKELTVEMREEEHKKFWRLGDVNEQSRFLLNHIRTVEKGTSKTPSVPSKEKNKSRKYVINDLRVCKGLFKNVYCVSNGRLGRLNKQRDAHPDSPIKDKRGGKEKEVNPVIMKALSDTLIALPKYISHYNRQKDRDDNIIYLEPDMTWTKVYSLVEEEVKNLDQTLQLPKMSWFMSKVNTLFPHVKCHTPGTDKCNTCSVLTLQEKLTERDAHQKVADAARKQLDEDMKEQHFFCFDLQQVQPLPFLKENKSFYNRKMWLYNFGTSTGVQPFFFLWTEIMASRGSREITSCLKKFMVEYLIKEDQIYDPLIGWSDSCGGQNRNFMMVCFFLWLLHRYENIKSLLHRFPEVGHSFLPNDRDFGDIEKAKKKKEAIYSVNQYVHLMENASKKKPKAIMMKEKDFVDFAEVVNFSNLSSPVDTDGNKFTWLKIHEFRYEQGLFGFMFKYEITDQEYRTCFLGRPSNKSKRPEAPVYKKKFQILYPHGRKLKAPKAMDMATLMQFVPPVHQGYYKSIIEDHQLIIDQYKKKGKEKKDDEIEELF